MKTTIGLFGTCGNSTWRDNFIALYKEKGINYFNPQLPEGTWTPECADIENQHFKKDDVILFPVTNETTAFGSLAEVGFSINTLLENPANHRYFIFMIDPIFLFFIPRSPNIETLRLNIKTLRLQFRMMSEQIQNDEK